MGLTLHQWSVFISGYIVYGLSVGLYYGMGALFPVIMDTFDATRAQTSIIQSIYAACLLGGGIIYGIITSKIGALKTTVMGSLAMSASLVLAFWATKLAYLIATSVITAIGLGMCFVACTVGVRQFFHGRSSVVALALISSSSGTMGIALTYILTYLSGMFGLKGTFLIIGGLELNCVVLCLLWKNKDKPRSVREAQNENGEDGTSNISSQYARSTHEIVSRPTNENETATTNKGRDFKNGTMAYLNGGYSGNGGHLFDTDDKDPNMNDITNKMHRSNGTPENKEQDSQSKQEHNLSTKTKLKHIFKNHSYLLTIVGIVFCFNSLNQYVVFLIDMYEDRGYSTSQGTTGLTIMNIAAVLGRAAPATIAHCPCYNTFQLPICSTLVAAVAIFLMTLAPTVVVLHILSGCIGFGYGVIVSVVVVTVSELVEPEYLAEAVGLLMSVIGAFALVGGPVTGYIRDTSGSYVISQILTSSFTGLGSSMFIIAACLQRRKNLQLQQKTRDSMVYSTHL